MADPKYADLPGIAYDQPDVYETNDLPEADQATDFYEESENESMEIIHLSASEAFNKFKGKYLNAKNVDFSEKVSRRIRTGYDARSGDWQLIGEGENETPLQKFQRLQCEIHELLDDVNKITEQVKDNKDKISPGVSIEQVEQCEKLLRELQLEKILGKEMVTNLSDPQGSRMQKLLSLLEQFKNSGLDDSTLSKPDKKQSSDDKKVDAITYTLEYRPEQAKLAQAARVGELEHRLHRLEIALGSESNQMNRLSQATSQKSIIESMQLLTAKSSALDSGQLDHFEGRLIALGQRLDNIGKQRTGTTKDSELEQMVNDLLNLIKKNKGKPITAEDAEIHQMASDVYELTKKINASSIPENLEKNQKINELYDFVKKIDQVMGILPQTVQRLNALNSFHQQAIEFNNSLTQLESLRSKILSDVQNNQELLKGVQEYFAINLESVNKNIATLNERINQLKQKK